MTSEKRQGEIITFYSYKGGTGRSMALANVACLLARQDVPGGVLMVDWDLEAPGLHRFFYDKLRKRFGDPVNGASQVDEHPGLMDLLLLLDRSVGEAKGTGEIDPETQTEQIVADIDLDRFVIETDISNLSLITAGCFNDGYSARINTFDWEGLYERSPYLYRTFAQWLAEHYRYVLIDSRTGFTDTSGICTMLIPEKLVVVFTPNRQSLSGISGLVRRATDYRRKSDDLRPLLVYPLPSRIESEREHLRKL